MTGQYQEEFPFTAYDEPQDKGCQQSEQKEQDAQKESESSVKGLSVLKTSFFLLAETSGSGLMAIPHVFDAAGYSAIVLNIVCGLVAMYTSLLLGQCGTAIRERHPEHRGHVRHPYAVIGQLSYGTPGRVAISIVGNLHLFSVTVVFLVLASQNIQSLLADIFDAHISFCYLELILAAILLPVTWMGSPKDMRLVGEGAALSTLLAVVLLMGVIVHDGQKLDTSIPAPHSTPDLMGTIQAVGVISYIYGSHSGYPVIQGDMKDPSKWNSVTYYTFTLMIIINTAVGLGGFLVYGSNVQGNVLLSVTSSPVLSVVQILITLHLMCAFVVVINPVVQELEELLKIRKEFSWRRIISRTMVVLCSLFIALSIPRFENLVALVGAAGATGLSFIAPCLCYLRLREMGGYQMDTTGSVPLHIRVICWEIVIVFIFIGVMASYSALASLYTPGSLVLPCYLDMEQ